MKPEEFSQNSSPEDSLKKKFSESPEMAALQKRALAGEGYVLYHGGLPPEATIDDIDLNRFGKQQNKPGRTYGGFYLTDGDSRKWSDQYARERNGNVHGFLIDIKARLLERDGVIDRLSAEERERLAKDYDLIRGLDALQRTQYVLLNKDIVLGTATETITETNRKDKTKEA